MAGFVAPSGAWGRFEEEWRYTLRNAGVAEPFHMNEFAPGAGQFQSWKDDRKRRELLLSRLLDVIEETNATPIGAVIHVPDFDSLTEEQRTAFREPYFFAFQQCTRGAATEAVFEPASETVDTIYAFNDEYGANKNGLAAQLWDAIRSNYEHGNRLGSYTACSPKDCCPLQAADLFAYELCKEFENRIKRPDDAMRYGLRRILKMSKIPMARIRLFDRKELLRSVSDGNLSDQTGVDELGSNALQSAFENMMRWAIERGDYYGPT